MFCPECGSKIGEDSVFCDNCGARLVEEAAGGERGGKTVAAEGAGAAKTERTSKNPWSILWLLPVLVLSTILLIAALLGLRKLQEMFGGGDGDTGATVTEPAAPTRWEPPPAEPEPPEPEPQIVREEPAAPPAAPEPAAEVSAQVPPPPPPPPPGAPGFKKFSDMTEEEFTIYTRALWERAQEEKK